MPVSGVGRFGWMHHYVVFDCADELRLALGEMCALRAEALANAARPLAWELYDPHITGYGDPLQGYSFDAGIGPFYLTVHTWPEGKSVQMFLNSDLKDDVREIQTVTEALAAFFGGNLVHAWSMPTGIQNPVIARR